VFDGQAWVSKSGKGDRQIRSPWDLDMFNPRQYEAVF
jgi:hypothetical protein